MSPDLGTPEPAEASPSHPMVQAVTGIDAFSIARITLKEKLMFGSSTYQFTLATEDDADALRELAELDSRAPLAGRVLIGRIAGSPAAALSLDDGRVVADPFRRTDHLVACLRSRAGAMRAYEATPSLSERMRAALRPAAHVAR